MSSSAALVSLAGKRGVVFGASSRYSIGLHVARAWRQAGAAGVTLACESEELCRKVADVAGAEGWWDPERCLAIKCDVRVDEDIAAVFEASGAQDMVLHAVARAPSSAMRAGSLLGVKREDFLSTMDVSAFSLLAVASKARFNERGGSLMSLTFHASERVVPGYGSMAPAKAVLETLTRYLAVELGPRNVRVNCLSPGPIKTPAARAIPNFMTMAEVAAKRSPFQRGVRVEEVAQAACFLASDMSSAITGEVMRINCGEHLLSG